MVIPKKMVIKFNRTKHTFVNMIKQNTCQRIFSICKVYDHRTFSVVELNP